MLVMFEFLHNSTIITLSLCGFVFFSSCFTESQLPVSVAVIYLMEAADTQSRLSDLHHVPPASPACLCLLFVNSITSLLSVSPPALTQIPPKKKDKREKKNPYFYDSNNCHPFILTNSSLRAFTLIAPPIWPSLCAHSLLCLVCVAGPF